MNSREMSMDIIMEDEEFSFVSNTDAIIYAASDISGWTHSLISDNNIPNSSSSTSVDEHHHHNHLQISTVAGGGGDKQISTVAGGGGDNHISTVAGGGGDNQISTVAGGSGDNQISTVAGGGGDNQISTVAGGGGDKQISTVAGGGGDNQISTVAGGGGDKQISTVAGGGGDNQISTVAGGGGDNQISTVAGGGGDNQISTVAGGGGDNQISTVAGGGGDKQISTVAGGGGDDLMIVSSGASSSSSKNNKQIDDQQEVRIFNVDFRALCNNNTCSGSEFRGGLLPDTGRIVNEEASAWLVNNLVACAKATEENNLSLVDVLISDIRRFTFSQIGGATKKVATYFAEAFYHKIHGLIPEDMAESPYPKRIHVIDFSLNQRPILLQPPAFQHDSTDPLDEIGFKLAQFAESIGVQIEFCGIKVHSLTDLEASMMNIRPSNVETVNVNSVFKFHPLFSIPGSIEGMRDQLKQIQPDITTIVKQEQNYNWSLFMNVVNVMWHFYSTTFDLLENLHSIYPNYLGVVMAEQLIGLEIYDFVANWEGHSSELEAQWNEVLLETIPNESVHSHS